MMIRVVSGILAFQGILWAMLSLSGLIVPLFALSSVFTGNVIWDKESVAFFLLSAQLYFGWFIWIGWWLRMLDSRYAVSRRTFWILSAVQHAIWVIAFSSGDLSADSAAFGRFLLGYSITVLVISIIFAFLDREPDTTKGAVLEAIGR
ncbi:MAG: hypothetical protein CMO55_11085 [Verrucomicrobiales bacterium]|nr:hypothetical protein [Verrucomicrobiales bacterium]